MKKIDYQKLTEECREELKKDFIEHGFDVEKIDNGKFVFSTSKRKYFSRVRRGVVPDHIHKNHPIWFDDNSKNWKTTNRTKPTITIVTMCGRCKKVVSGLCECGNYVPVPTRKMHIPWKHEMNVEKLNLMRDDIKNGNISK